MRKKKAPLADTLTTARLKVAGLRPTRQRIALARLLFGRGNRHVSAESLYDESVKAGVPVSLATIYNTLHQFTRAGLLQQIVLEPGRNYFDTNTGEHQHFYSEDDGALFDIPGDVISVSGVPEPPRGMAVDRVEVVVRLKRA